MKVSTGSFVTSASRSATGNEGCRVPSLILVTKGRDTRAFAASVASVSPVSVIHSLSVMARMCHKGTTPASVDVPGQGYTLGPVGVTIWPMAKGRHFIREWRKFRDLTQEQLAERIGINRPYLSKIESGKRRYDQPFLEAAAEALRCAPADLIMRDPSDPDGIWDIWEALSPPQRNQVVEIAKTIKRTGTDG